MDRSSLACLTLAEVAAWLEDRALTAAEMELLACDTRAGVQRLLTSYRRRKSRLERAAATRERLVRLETEVHREGFGVVCGVDEAGRGPLAGPVVAAAVVFPAGCYVEGVNDSKQLTADRRENLFAAIHEAALSVGVGVVSAEEIDQINILRATHRAMRLAVEALNVRPDLALIDGLPVKDFVVPHRAIVAGDASSHVIAAASIVAKVTRDRMMLAFDQLYPGYGFAGNKGYGTPEHLAALEALGPCPIHRHSFAPVGQLDAGVAN